MTGVILASASASRAKILRNAGVEFEVAPAHVDEEAIKDSMLAAKQPHRAIADGLAELKAQRVSTSHPDHIVIAADQTLSFEGELISKCESLAEARALLSRLRGRTHELFSAVVLARGGAVTWRHIAKATMTMREFSDASLDAHLAAGGESLLSGVGCYRLEDRGSQLFARVDGDYFAILGLPLLPLLSALREQGVIPAMSISGKAKLAGVIGWPIAHSLSPRLHGYWLAAHAIDGAYVPLAVAKEDFARVIDALQRVGFAGVNVTVPHKEAAFAIAHELDAAALATGAVNLLLFREDGKIEGRNSDAGGLAASLAEELGKNALHGKSAVVLGAGGAARAAVLALSDLGVKDIRIVARDERRALSLIKELSATVKPLLKHFTWKHWGAAAKDAGILVNATSAGMAGGCAPDVDLAAMPVSAIVCDLVYNPLETDLLRRAKAVGLRPIEGLGMLMHQAVPAFAAFYGETPKVNPALRAELKKGLRNG